MLKQLQQQLNFHQHHDFLQQAYHNPTEVITLEQYKGIYNSFEGIYKIKDYYVNLKHTVSINKQSDQYNTSIILSFKNTTKNNVI